MKKFLVVMSVVLMAVWLSGCNTARGLGADVERLGQMMQGKEKPVEAAVMAPVEAIGVLEQAPIRYVQPGETVSTFPLQSVPQSSAYPLKSRPASPVMPAGASPKLGETPPPAINVKEM